MKNIKYIIPIMMLVVLLSGCTNKQQKQDNTNTSNTNQATQTTDIKQEDKSPEVVNPEAPKYTSKGIVIEKDENIFKNDEKFKGSVEGLFQNEKGIKCINTDKAQGVTVIMYVDGKNKRMRSETTIGKNTIYSLTPSDKALYVWNQLLQGAKVEGRLQQESFESKMNYQKCSEWTVEESLMSIPTDVDFKNDIYKVTSVLTTNK